MIKNDFHTAQYEPFLNDATAALFKLTHCPSANRASSLSVLRYCVGTLGSFAWGEVSADDGATWRLAVEFLARRVDAA